MRAREFWIDNVKIFACILVLLGHFFQSMTEAEIMPVTDTYNRFITCIYLFHVQLFFICSGYLYQKGNAVNSFETWKRNVLKKLLVLGVPYVTFSLVTFALKVVFSSAVNNAAEDIVTTLFVHPVNQYWYFYILFIFFVITPTLNNHKMAVSVSVFAVLLKVMNIMQVFGDVYVLKRISESLIWFVMGMLICKYLKNRLNEYRAGALLIAVFFVGFTFVYKLNAMSKLTDFFLGFIACTGIITVFRGMGFFNKDTKLAEYTMPVFLMHTIVAAALRSILLHMGITSFAVHALIGIPASILGPVIIYEIMKRNRFLLFFIDPRGIKTKPIK